MATLKTFQPQIWKKLEKMELPVKPKERLNSKGEIISKSFQIPKHWIHIHGPKDFIRNREKIISNFFKKFWNSK